MLVMRGSGGRYTGEKSDLFFGFDPEKRLPPQISVKRLSPSGRREFSLQLPFNLWGGFWPADKREAHREGTAGLLRRAATSGGGVLLLCFKVGLLIAA